MGKNHPNHQATTHAFAAVDAYGRELVDRLREIGLDKHIELPQIAVMGDTSSGKSSLLSALSGVDFPSSDELTTRCPTQLVLNTGTAFRGSVHLHRYATKKNEHHDVLTSIHDVPRAIEKLTQLLVDENQEISDDAIVIELCGPNLPNLTLCDLPGLVRAVQDGQDKSIIPRVREMVNRYMKQSRTVIMAVVPANVDMHNVEILQDAQEADPEGTRTIAVVTKLDLVDAGAEKSVEMLLLNRKKKLTLGYHAVKCRGQKDLNSGMNISTGLKREQEFFLTHEYWGARLARDKWGIEALSTRLVKIMQDNIQRSMPSVIKEIQAKIEEDITELESMGSSFDNAGERRRVFCEWVDRFVRPMQAVLKGDYDTLPTLAMVDSDEVDLRLRAKIRNMDEVFKEKIMATKDQMPGLTSDCELELDDLVNVEVNGYVGTYRVTEVSAKGDIKCTAFPDEWLGSSRYEPNKLNHLRRFIVQNRGDELAIFPPYSVFCSIFRQWIDTWEEPMLELVRQYYQLTRSVATRLAKELKAPPPAQEFFQRSVAETLDERRQEAEHELQNLLAMERRPYTQNGELTSVFTQMLRPGLETLLRQRLHVNSAGAVEFGALLEVLTDFSRVSDEHDTVVMDSGLRAYFQLASTRFVDAVPMKLDRVVLQGFVQKMQQQLQTTSDAKLERLLCEPESVRARRSELSDSLATLHLAKRQIEDLY